MGEPRTTTLDDLTEFDLGHVVRFRRPEPDLRGGRFAKGTLISFTRTTYHRGMMPVPGFMIRLSMGTNAVYALRPMFEDHGPLPAHHKIDVLDKAKTAPQDRSPVRSRTVGSAPAAAPQHDSADLSEAMELLRAHIADKQGS